MNFFNTQLFTYEKSIVSASILKMNDQKKLTDVSAKYSK